MLLRCMASLPASHKCQTATCLKLQAVVPEMVTLVKPAQADHWCRKSPVRLHLEAHRSIGGCRPCMLEEIASELLISLCRRNIPTWVSGPVEVIHAHAWGPSGRCRRL